MKRGYLSEYFKGVAAKRLSAVEAEPGRSTQHEFNGVVGLEAILGPAGEPTTRSATFIYLNDDDPPLSSEGFVTWYDARRNKPPRREPRLYFPTTDVSSQAAEGDLLVVGLLANERALILIVKASSTAESQVSWLFGLGNVAPTTFSVKEESDVDHVRLGFASRFILEELGIELDDTDDSYLERMLSKFGGRFPTTRMFSAFARATLVGVSPKDEPDSAIVAYLEHEELLFRTLERHLIAGRLKAGFGNDVDAFISFSLSVQNRRKSRVGSAVQNHLEVIFLAHGVRFQTHRITENRSKPDFLFPGETEYHDRQFTAAALTMLGVKSSCKERWRQVLLEADRIESKHLFTLEPRISANQTAEMTARHLTLVLPASIHSTYMPEQQPRLMSLADFVSLVLERQNFGH